MVPLGGGAIHYDEAALKKGIKSSQYDNTPPGVFFIGDEGWHTGKSDTEVQWRNFSPSAGLAWDMNGDGRISLRASVGTFYDFPSTDYQNPATAPPWSPRYTLSDVNYADPWGRFTGGDPFPVKFGKDITRDVQWPLYGLVTASRLQTKNMRVTSWNLSMQRQVGTDWLVSANYLGNETYHMWSAQQLNAPVFLGLGPCTLAESRIHHMLHSGQSGPAAAIVDRKSGSRKILRLCGSPRLRRDSHYNGLLLSVQRRAARGVTVNANYTWSHYISDTGAGDN